jgi:hypothetical protein
VPTRGRRTEVEVIETPTGPQSLKIKRVIGSADREQFRLAAESALVAAPSALRSPGADYRVIERVAVNSTRRVAAR